MLKSLFSTFYSISPFFFAELLAVSFSPLWIHFSFAPGLPGPAYLTVFSQQS